MIFSDENPGHRKRGKIPAQEAGNFGWRAPASGLKPVRRRAPGPHFLAFCVGTYPDDALQLRRDVPRSRAPLPERQLRRSHSCVDFWSPHKLDLRTRCSWGQVRLLETSHTHGLIFFGAGRLFCNLSQKDLVKDRRQSNTTCQRQWVLSKDSGRKQC